MPMTILRWIPSDLLNLASVLLTWLLASILALCYTTDDNGREWLIRPLRWFQTHDNPVDEWRVGGLVSGAISFYFYKLII